MALPNGNAPLKAFDVLLEVLFYETGTVAEIAAQEVLEDLGADVGSGGGIALEYGPPVPSDTPSEAQRGMHLWHEAAESVCAPRLSAEEDAAAFSRAFSGLNISLLASAEQIIASIQQSECLTGFQPPPACRRPRCSNQSHSPRSTPSHAPSQMARSS